MKRKVAELRDRGESRKLMVQISSAYADHEKEDSGLEQSWLPHRISER